MKAGLLSMHAIFNITFSEDGTMLLSLVVGKLVYQKLVELHWWLKSKVRMRSPMPAAQIFDETMAVLVPRREETNIRPRFGRFVKFDSFAWALDMQWMRRIPRQDLLFWLWILSRRWSVFLWRWSHETILIVDKQYLLEPFQRRMQMVLFFLLLCMQLWIMLVVPCWEHWKILVVIRVSFWNRGFVRTG